MGIKKEKNNQPILYQNGSFSDCGYNIYQNDKGSNIYQKESSIALNITQKKYFYKYSIFILSFSFKQIRIKTTQQN